MVEGLNIADLYNKVGDYVFWQGIHNEPILKWYVLVLAIYILVYLPISYAWLSKMDKLSLFRWLVIIGAGFFTGVVFLMSNSTRFDSKFYYYTQIVRCGDSRMERSMFLKACSPYNTDEVIRIRPEYELQFLGSENDVKGQGFAADDLSDETSGSRPVQESVTLTPVPDAASTGGSSSTDLSQYLIEYYHNEFVIFDTDRERSEGESKIVLKSNKAFETYRMFLSTEEQYEKGIRTYEEGEFILVQNETKMKFLDVLFVLRSETEPIGYYRIGNLEPGEIMRFKKEHISEKLADVEAENPKEAKRAETENVVFERYMKDFEKEQSNSFGAYVYGFNTNEEYKPEIDTEQSPAWGLTLWEFKQ